MNNKIKVIVLGTAILLATASISGCNNNKSSYIFSKYAIEALKNNNISGIDGFISLDGKLDDSIWHDKVWLEENADGRTDVTVKMASCLGDKGVYFAFDVKDNEVYANAERGTYNNSGIELYLASSSATALDHSAFEIDINADGELEVRKHINGSYVSSASKMYAEVQLDGTINTSECKGYTIELFVPYETLGVKGKPDYVNAVPALIRSQSAEISAGRKWDNIGLRTLRGYDWNNPSTWYQFGGEGLVSGKVTVNPSQNGTIQPRRNYVISGQPFAMFVKSDEGYMASSVKLNGVECVNRIIHTADGAKIVVDNVKGDVTIDSEYVKIPSVKNHFSGKVTGTTKPESVQLTVEKSDYIQTVTVASDGTFSADIPAMGNCRVMATVDGKILYNTTMNFNSAKNNVAIALADYYLSDDSGNWSLENLPIGEIDSVKTDVDSKLFYFTDSTDGAVTYKANQFVAETTVAFPNGAKTDKRQGIVLGADINGQTTYLEFNVLYNEKGEVALQVVDSLGKSQCDWNWDDSWHVLSEKTQAKIKSGAPVSLIVARDGANIYCYVDDERITNGRFKDGIYNASWLGNTPSAIGYVTWGHASTFSNVSLGVGKNAINSKLAYTMTGSVKLNNNGAVSSAFGAKVEIVGATNIPVLTDANGNFSIPNAMKGFCRIRISKPGYLTHEMSVNIDSRTRNLGNIYLEYETLTTTGPWDLTQMSSGTVSHIGGEQWEHAPYSENYAYSTTISGTKVVAKGTFRNGELDSRQGLFVEVNGKKYSPTFKTEGDNVFVQMYSKNTNDAGNWQSYALTKEEISAYKNSGLEMTLVKDNGTLYTIVNGRIVNKETLNDFAGNARIGLVGCAPVTIRNISFSTQTESVLSTISGFSLGGVEYEWDLKNLSQGTIQSTSDGIDKRIYFNGANNNSQLNNFMIKGSFAFAGGNSTDKRQGFVITSNVNGKPVSIEAVLLKNTSGEVALQVLDSEGKNDGDWNWDNSWCALPNDVVQKLNSGASVEMMLVRNGRNLNIYVDGNRISTGRLVNGTYSVNWLNNVNTSVGFTTWDCKTAISNISFSDNSDLSSYSENVSGNVKIDKYGTTIPADGATVSILNTEYTAVTDSQGNFTIASVICGKYKVRVTSDGCVPYETDVQISKSNGNIGNITLEYKPFALNGNAGEWNISNLGSGVVDSIVSGYDKRLYYCSTTGNTLNQYKVSQFLAKGTFKFEGSTSGDRRQGFVLTADINGAPTSIEVVLLKNSGGEVALQTLDSYGKNDGDWNWDNSWCALPDSIVQKINNGEAVEMKLAREGKNLYIYVDGQRVSTGRFTNGTYSLDWLQNAQVGVGYVTWDCQTSISGVNLITEADTINADIKENVSGNVKQNKNGTPVNLSGATVTFVNSGYSATTDANGNFAIADVLNGKYKVRITADECAPFEAEVQVTKDNGNLGTFTVEYKPFALNGNADEWGLSNLGSGVLDSIVSDYDKRIYYCSTTGNYLNQYKLTDFLAKGTFKFEGSTSGDRRQGFVLTADINGTPTSIEVVLLKNSGGEVAVQTLDSYGKNDGDWNWDNSWCALPDSIVQKINNGEAVEMKLAREGKNLYLYVDGQRVSTGRFANGTYSLDWLENVQVGVGYATWDCQTSISGVKLINDADTIKDEIKENVSGNVKQNKSGTITNLSGATVTFVGTGYSSVTDAEGNFAIPDAMIGTSKVRITADNCVAYETDITVNKGNGNVGTLTVQYQLYTSVGPWDLSQMNSGTIKHNGGEQWEFAPYAENYAYSTLSASADVLIKGTFKYSGDSNRQGMFVEVGGKKYSPTFNWSDKVQMYTKADGDAGGWSDYSLTDDMKTAYASENGVEMKLVKNASKLYVYVNNSLLFSDDLAEFAGDAKFGFVGCSDVTITNISCSTDITGQIN